MAGYETKVEHIALDALADVPNLIIRSLKDRQQYDDDDGAAERAGISSAAWSHFGQIWGAGRALAEHVATVPVAGRKVLELGCGIGLASLVLARLGVDVTASDIHPLAAAFLGANLALNGLAPLPFHTGDWRALAPTLGRFELIVGSDLLYEPSPADDLSEFIDRHSAARAEVIIIDPNRGQRSAFKKRMAALAFASTVRQAPSRTYGGVAFRGQILGFVRGA